MKSYQNRQGFTLVELIVVITILAILGTIGFLSLQGYSANARDSKRTADMRSISTAVSTKTTEGVKYVWFVANGTTAGSRMATTGSGISGQTLNYTVNYDSGTPNYATLGIDPSKFKDPQNTEYRIGGTTLQAGAFQVAAKLEAGGQPVSTVSGNYIARSGVSSITATGSTGVFTINSANIAKFERGDVVTITGGAFGSGTINNISGDGLSLTITPSPGTGSTITLSLTLPNEVAGLIKQTGAGTAAVTDNSTTLLPY